MNWMEFISSIIRSIAWPIIVLIAVLLLKKPVSQLIIKIAELKLKTVRYGDWELNFGEELDQVETELNNSETTHESSKDEGSKVVDKNSDSDLVGTITVEENVDFIFQRLVYEAPYLAVIKSWIDLEEEIYNTLKRIGSPIIAQKAAANPARVYIKYLISNEYLSNSFYDVFLELFKLRNLAVHKVDSATTITAKDAKRYHKLTLKLINELKNINPN